MKQESSYWNADGFKLLDPGYGSWPKQTLVGLAGRVINPLIVLEDEEEEAEEANLATSEGRRSILRNKAACGSWANEEAAGLPGQRACAILFARSLTPGHPYRRVNKGAETP